MRSHTEKTSNSTKLEVVRTFDNEGKTFQELMEEILKELLSR